MGRGATEPPASSHFLYGPTEKRRFSSREENFDLVMVIDLIEPETQPPISYRFDVGKIFSAVVNVGAIKELSESEWRAPWLGALLQEYKGRYPVIAEYIDRADANSELWECRLDPESATAWCRRRGIKIE